MAQLYEVGKLFARGSNGPGSDDSSSSQNRQTIVDTSIGLWSRPAMTAPIAFLRYRKELAAARARYNDRHVFVAVVDSDGEANRSIVLAPGQSAILGRHTRCDLQINHQNVALRQLALYVSEREHPIHGRTLLRVWDLHTGKTLTCEDGSEVEALEADGPVFISLGRYHLAMIPLGQLPQTLPVSTREAWASLPKREFAKALAQGTGTTMLPEMRMNASTSSITCMPSSVGLEALEDGQKNPLDVVATLVVQGQDRRREFQVGSEHLERGILIGRYHRCVGSGLDRRVSRVHLMIAAIGGQIVAMDTGSTTGSNIGSEFFKTATLVGPKKIWLSKHSYLVWRPTID